MTQTVEVLTGPGGLADRLGRSIADYARQLDEGRDLPAALLAELRDAGAFGLLTPVELGGSEAPLTTVLTVYEELGRLDASVAWVVWNGNFGFIGALLGEEGNRRIWADGGSGPVFANGLAAGTATPAGGHFSVSGAWRMVSGIAAADWLIVVAVVTDGGAPRITSAGLPDARVFAVPRDQVTVQDTWDVSGLRGTGSDDVRLSEVSVPECLSARLNVPPRLDRPLYRGFIPALVLPGCSAIALGVAAAAIDEVVRLSDAPEGPTLAGSPRRQAIMAESEAGLRGARLLLYAAAEAIQRANDLDMPETTQQRADLRAAMSHAAQVSRRVLTTMYELAGPAALYRGQPLGRLFRDGMAVLQHADHSADAFEGAGRVRLGLAAGMLHF